MSESCFKYSIKLLQTWYLAFATQTVLWFSRSYLLLSRYDLHQGYYTSTKKASNNYTFRRHLSIQLSLKTHPSNE